MKSLKTINQINDYLARYRLFVEQENRANRYNINIRAESFFLPLLRILFQCPNLININISDRNYPSIDLRDREKRIAFQVTSENSSSKIVSSLETFNKKKEYKDFDQLFFFIITEKQKSYTSQKILEISKIIQEKNPKFHFNFNEHIIDTRFISERLNDIDSPTLEDLLFLFALEIDGDFNSPLSKYPKKQGPFYNIDLIGENRESIFDRLLTDDKDILLIGKPGIGKTFLLQKLTGRCNAYFLNKDSKYNLLQAIKLLTPDIIFIDDAHKNIEELEKIVQIRELYDLTFRVIATSWQIQELARVKQVGMFNEQQEINLQVFTKDELAELILNILKEKNLIRQFYWEQLIIDYSNGLPGLAVRMLDTCIKTGGKEVLEGTSILTFLADISLETRNNIEWITTKKILSLISVFGNSGVPISTISSILETPIIYIETLLESFYYSGTIFKNWRGVLVRPKALRAVLVKEEYFGEESLQFNFIASISNSIIDYNNLIEVLLDVVRIGGRVPVEILFQLMSNTNSTQLWSGFYFLFPEMIDRGTELYPNTLSASIEPSLINAPEKTISKILLIANDDDRPLHSNPDHVLRKLEDWVNIDAHTTETITKRQMVLKNLSEFSLSGGKQRVIEKVIEIIISPKYETTDSPPGSGNVISFGTGIYSRETLSSIKGLWKDSLKIISELPPNSLSELINSLYSWAQPSRVISDLPEEMISYMRNISKVFIVDLSRLCKEHPSLYKQLNEINQFYPQNNLEEMQISEERIKLYSTLFPTRKEFFEKENVSFDREIKRLANEIVKSEISNHVKEIKWARDEAYLLNTPLPDLTDKLFSIIAKDIDTPLEWLRLLKENDLIEYSLPFLRKIVSSQASGWKDIIKDLLSSDKTRILVYLVIFEIENPPEELLRACLSHIDEVNPEWIRGICTQGRVSERVTKKFLINKSKAISFNAAIGEWGRKPNKSVRDSLIEEWNEVIKNTHEFDYALVDIFKEKPRHILNWLEFAYFDYIDKGSYNDEMLIMKIIELLEETDREKFLDSIITNNKQKIEEIRLFAKIIDNSMDLYKYLMTITDIEKHEFYILTPLTTFPENENWVSFSMMALDKGATEERIASSTLQPDFFLAQSTSDTNEHYHKCKEVFETLLQNNDNRIKRIANIGLKGVIDNIERNKNRELEKDIYGWD